MNNIPEITATLLYVYEPPRILLGLKKRGFGVGRWNGFGGKVATGEDIETAARRELFEESGLRAGALEEYGRLHFTLQGRPFTMDVHVLKVLDYSGDPIETEEMRPQWFQVAALPFESMWPEDKYWLHLFLEGKKFRGAFVLDEADEVVTHNLDILS